MELQLEEFLEELDASNPFYQDLAYDLSYDRQHNRLILARKNEELLETIIGILGQGLTPIVDKSLQIVIGLPFGTHEAARLALWRYHARPEYPCGGRYTADGYGYYISSMQRKVILVGTTYVNDKNDRKVFEFFETREVFY